MPNGFTTTIGKTCDFARRAARKSVSQPGEALLLCRMAWWISVLSLVARCCSLPRALAIVAGSETNGARLPDAEFPSRDAGVHLPNAAVHSPGAAVPSSHAAVELPHAAVQERLARSIDLLLSADFFLFKPICWKRAAVLHRYLSRNGIATRIIFGVRNESDGTVAGHAWLEAEGKPILESAPPEYVVTYQFP